MNTTPPQSWSQRMHRVLAGTLVYLLTAPTPSVQLQAQPRSPDDEARSFHLSDPELTVELVAAEPMVESPVAIAWDAAGRGYVAEMRDYPTGPASGRIRLLVDHNGDGRPETSFVFADGLAFPNSVLPWRDGVLVTTAPDLIYLRDRDGDGQAEERRTLIRGFGQGNQQLRANGLVWGMDGWVYGANGRSDGEIQWCDDQGQTIGPRVSLRGRDFRFRPDTGAIEALAGRSQFGLALDDWGRRFLSWNTIPVRHEVIPDRYWLRQTHSTWRESLQDLLPPDDDQRVFPATPAPPTFNQESTRHFNALSGLTLYRGDALGEAGRETVWVGETLLNLVHRRRLVPDQSTFQAVRLDQGREFLASEDPWFHPVHFATGPDGALYLVDFYRKWVEHPDFVQPPEKRAQVNWREGAERGRIWRVVPRRRPLPPSTPTLQTAEVATLVSALDHPNGWRRDTAHRLLWERRDASAVAPLQTILTRTTSHGTPAARRHALWLLEHLGQLPSALLRQTLSDTDASVASQALLLAEKRAPTDDALLQALLQLTPPSHAPARLQFALTLGTLPSPQRIPILVQLLAQALTVRDATAHPRPATVDQAPAPDAWLARAVTTGLGSDGPTFVAAFLQQTPLESLPRSVLTRSTLQELGFQVGAALPLNALWPQAPWLAQLPTERAHEASWALLAGLAEGSRPTQHPWSRAAAPPSTLPAEIASRLAAWRDQSATAVHQATATEPTRQAALRFLAAIAPNVAPDTALGLLRDPDCPPTLSAEAIRQWNEQADPARSPALFQSWSSYPTLPRRRLLNTLAQGSRWQAPIVAALENKSIQPAELDASARRVLLRAADNGLRSRAERMLETPLPASGRAATLQVFRPALEQPGDPARGRTIFTARCAACHVRENLGTRVGPDLADLSSRGRETVLLDILDPNRAVAQDYLAYRVTWRSGEIASGLIVRETAQGIVLRQANLPDRNIASAEIERIDAENQSLMPEGLEAGLDVQGMADLLHYLVASRP